MRRLSQFSRGHLNGGGRQHDPAEGYRAFRGHDPAVWVLMRDRGLPDLAE